MHYTCHTCIWMIVSIPNEYLVVFVISIVFCFEFIRSIPTFIARKGTHMLSGIMLLLCTNNTWWLKYFVVLFALFVVSQAWIPQRPWRFAAKRDIGITFFGIIVSIWAIFEWDFKALTPLFFADPMGAIVGKAIKTPKWIGEKTVAGSLAVFITAVLTTGYVCPSLRDRILLGGIVTVCEAIGGKYDNATMSIPLILFYINQKTENN